MEVFIVIGIVFALTNIPPFHCAQPYQQLYNDLFVSSGYTANTRPMNSTGGPLTISIVPSLYSIIDVNEAEETVTYAMWFRREWIDPTLTWDPTQYNNMSSITVKDDVLWMPDVVMYELLDQTPAGDTPYATVASNGLIIKSSSVMVKIHCSLDVGNFPYDQQNCSSRYVSWAYSGKDLILLSGSGNNGDSTYYNNNTEFDLLAYDAVQMKLEYNTGTYYEVHYHIVFKRKPDYYLLTLTLPCYIIVTIAILGLFSPFIATQDRQEKITMGLTALLTIAVILMMVSDLMPKNAKDFPKLGTYIVYEMVITVLATIVAAGILYLNSMAAFGYSVPSWMLTITMLKPLKVEQSSKAAEASGFTRLISPPVGVHADEKEKIIEVLYHILAHLKHLRTKLEDKEDEGQLFDHWMHVCFRLDLFFLLFFLLINTFMTMSFFFF